MTGGESKEKICDKTNIFLFNCFPSIGGCLCRVRSVQTVVTMLLSMYPDLLNDFVFFYSSAHCSLFRSLRFEDITGSVFIVTESMRNTLCRLRTVKFHSLIVRTLIVFCSSRLSKAKGETSNAAFLFSLSSVGKFFCPNKRKAMFVSVRSFSQSICDEIFQFFFSFVRGLLSFELVLFHCIFSHKSFNAQDVVADTRGKRNSFSTLLIEIKNALCFK